MVAPLFFMMDADGDERISKEEFLGYFEKIYADALSAIESATASE